ncbi:MAG: xanthine dehydrogenase family protein molybdopterin-binding subunit [Acidimicrobiales bacterium]|nr:xanthine dehydrogenase family protein molybdopterin-binding subunit [Acidimicrobiales bacterium]
MAELPSGFGPGPDDKDVTADRWVGQRLTRAEDVGYLRGETPFIADLRHPLLEDVAHVSFVRSPFAHAHITNIDVSEAMAAPGVLDVVTASDHEIIPTHSVFPEYFDAIFAMPLLAEGRARYVGQPVVAIVADSEAAAVDAAELVIVDYEPLPAVMDLREAASNATLIYPVGSGARARTPSSIEAPGTNVAMEHLHPHTPAAFEAPVVLSQNFVNPRQLPTPIEPYGEACAWDSDGSLHVWAATQRPHGFRTQLADYYGVAESKIHVTAPEGVGGGFGGKVSRTPEEHVLPLLAQRTGRPVRWVQNREEYFLGGTQGRGEEIALTLAGGHDGRIVALRSEMLKDSGSCPGVGANLPSRFNSLGAGGPYDIAHVEFEATSVVTNAPQVSAFRGAGRGPYLAALEMMVDRYAHHIGVDPVEVRRRNLVRAEQMPFTSGTGVVFDPADYVGDLETALDAIDYPRCRRDQDDRLARGDRVVMGIGVATYHLMTVGGGGEDAEVTVEADGTAVVRTGTTSQGHGHMATWAQIAADELGIDPADIRVEEGSTQYTADGVGAVGSRSMQTAGVAVQTAARGVIEQTKRIAADLLEASPTDIVFDPNGPDGERFHVAGVPSKALSWAALVHSDAAITQDFTCGDHHDVGSDNSFPSGCHIAVVEVDTETGAVKLVRYVAVDDAGVRVNPLIVEGQLHGGIAAGVGQVLGEVMRYDPDGNPLTTSFLDYGIATIDEFPPLELVESETATTFNELGAKGVGESGVIGAVPAMHGAVLDALRRCGVDHLDLPCTPQRVWSALRDAEFRPTRSEG